MQVRTKEDEDNDRLVRLPILSFLVPFVYFPQPAKCTMRCTVHWIDTQYMLAGLLLVESVCRMHKVLPVLVDSHQLGIRTGMCLPSAAFNLRAVMNVFKELHSKTHPIQDGCLDEIFLNLQLPFKMNHCKSLVEPEHLWIRFEDTLYWTQQLHGRHFIFSLKNNLIIYGRG